MNHKITIALKIIVAIAKPFPFCFFFFIFLRVTIPRTRVTTEINKGNQLKKVKIIEIELSIGGKLGGIMK